MAQLRCENISVGYEDGIVVSDVSFELNRGDYVCIVVFFSLLSLFNSS